MLVDISVAHSHHIILIMTIKEFVILCLIKQTPESVLLDTYTIWNKNKLLQTVISSFYNVKTLKSLLN